MNEVQKKILNIIQARFPITHRPYAVIAKALGCDEPEILQQTAELKAQGIIRRIGAIFDAAHLGYCSTLVAAKVPNEKLKEFVDAVNLLPGVSHNYGRAHAFNVWFTLTVSNPRLLDDILHDLRHVFQLTDLYSLPAERLFKINVNFDLDGNGSIPVSQPTPSPSPTATPPLKEHLSYQQMALVRQLQEDLPVLAEPFQWVAGQILMPAENILEQIVQWKQSGLIRRFGATLQHQKAGFNINAMIVFEVSPQQMEATGHQVAAYPQVSHCYQRPTAPDWPYHLFAMTHCRTEEELQKLVTQMLEQIHPLRYDILRTTTEYKKTNVKYFIE
jgi:siroheme decarboxylase